MKSISTNNPATTEIAIVINNSPYYQLLRTIVAILLHFQVCSIHHTVLQMKNSTRSTSAIDPLIYVWTILMTASCTEAITRYLELKPMEKEVGHKGGQR